MKPNESSAPGKAGKAVSSRVIRAALLGWLASLCVTGLLYATGVLTGISRVFYGGNVDAGGAIWQWVPAVLVAGFLAWLMVDIASLVLRLTVAVVTLVEVAVMGWVLSTFGVAWCPTVALVAGGGAVAFGLVYCQTADGRRKGIVETLFAGKISEATANAFIDSKEPFRPYGEQREASSVTCEIFNRLRLEDILPASAYMALLNQFGRVVRVALKQAGGIVEQTSGESVVAFFGAFVPSKDHAAEASLAAVYLASELEHFRGECIENWEVVLDCRIAVNSGSVVTGLAGGASSPGYRVVGSSVDFGHRLCLANQFYGSQILMGPQAYDLAGKSVEVRPLDLVRRTNEEPGKPKFESFEIYELLAVKGDLPPEEQERRDLFWRGVILYRSRLWEEAAKCFEVALNDAGSEDAPARLYLNRIAMRQKGVEVAECEWVKG